MAIDPGTAILVGKGLVALGGLASGDKNKKKDRKEQQRQFNEDHRWGEEYGRTQNVFDQNQALTTTARSLENAPLRDKVLYMLTQRAGMTPGEFKPRDMMNPWTAGSQAPSQGGIDLAALGEAAGKYTMGAGGVDPRIYQAMMAKLGMTMGPNGPLLSDPVIRPGSILPNQGPGPIVGPGGITNPESVDTSGLGPNGRANLPPPAPMNPALPQRGAGRRPPYGGKVR